MKKEHPIEALIAQGEHRQLDFKFEVSDSKKIARTLSAFANTDGGRLLIGVKDNGHITGIQGDEEYYMIEAASELYTKPVVPFVATRWDIKGKCVLEVSITPGSDRPYLAPDKDDIYRAYIRVADENKPANEVLLLSWKKQKNPEGTLLKITRPVERLFSYLEKNPAIHLNQFCREARINYYTARNILSDLIAIGSIRYVVKDNRIVYERVPE
jgi:hypothetical protein